MNAQLIPSQISTGMSTDKNLFRKKTGDKTKNKIVE